MTRSELALQSTTVSVSQYGEIGWLKKLITTSTCQMNFKNFPNDEQVCSLELVSWKYDNNSIFLEPIPRNDVIRQHDNWNITKIETSVRYESADCCRYPFRYIIIKVHIKRQATPLTLGLVVPSSLLSILVLISFVLPADSGERISLCITLLLTVTLFQQLTSEMIPRSQIPNLSWYHFVLLIVLMLALIANAIVINLYFGTDREMPSLFKKIVLGFFGSMLYSSQKEKLALKIHLDENLLNENSNKVYACRTCYEQKQLRMDWINACIILDRLFFLSFIVIFSVAIIWVALV